MPTPLPGEPPEPGAPSADELLLVDLSTAVAALDVPDGADAPRLGSMLEAAAARRPFRTPARDVEIVPCTDAYDQMHLAVASRLDGLTDDQWDTVVPFYGWTVTQLVAHLIAIDAYFAERLGLDPETTDAVTALDHVGMTLPVVEAWTNPPAETLRRWRDGARRISDHLRSLPETAFQERTRYHMVEVRLQSVVDIRLFELWTHLEDLDLALGRRHDPVDPRLLRRMARTAVPAVPLGLLTQGIDVGPLTVRFVLTGEGGGTFDQPTRLGDSPGPAELVVVADVTEFCRMASQRLAVTDLECEIEGDRAIGLQVLAGAGAFSS